MSLMLFIVISNSSHVLFLFSIQFNAECYLVFLRSSSTAYHVHSQALLIDFEDESSLKANPDLGIIFIFAMPHWISYLHSPTTLLDHLQH